MNQNEKIMAIKARYEQEYPLPASHKEAVALLIEVYEKFALKDGLPLLNESQKQGMGEYYGVFVNAGAPFYILLEAIYRHSHKHPHKRSFEYLVGMLKNWRVYGVCNDPTSEQRSVQSYFESRGLFLSQEQHDEIGGYLTNFGGFNLGVVLGGIVLENFAEQVMIRLRESIEPSHS